MCAVFMVLTLCSCARVIRSPHDEITMYSWHRECENGNVISLSFDGDDAVFSAKNDRFSLHISGYCLVGDDRLVIFDRKTQVNHSFSYILHGDCVELSCYGGTVKLDKIIGDNS